MKKTLITTTLFLACSGVFAQALSEKDLQEIQSSFKKDASTKAIQNILTADKDIKGNALNRDLQGKIDHYFKYRADVKGITNQLSSGRCWMFTSMNVLRPSIMKKYNLSQMLEQKDAGVPRCSCGGIIKPDVVLYEEPLDNDVMAGAISYIMAADLMIVGGTSLAVYPAAGLLQYYQGKELVLINKTQTPYDRRASLAIRDNIGQVMEQALSLLD